ncbi:MAG TPA: hypothetical protein VK506_04980 [Conexibacter sp.]|nr:hypothetical protein [Conexibacter sp.]
MSVQRLHPDDVDAIASRVVELLDHGRGSGRAEARQLVDAGAIAAQFGVSRSWVYEHATELGAIRLGEPGEGRRPRLRFDVERVAEILEASPAPAAREEPRAATSQAARRGGHANPSGGPMLPIKGR